MLVQAIESNRDFRSMGIVPHVVRIFILQQVQLQEESQINQSSISKHLGSHISGHIRHRIHTLK